MNSQTLNVNSAKLHLFWNGGSTFLNGRTLSFFGKGSYKHKFTRCTIEFKKNQNYTMFVKK